MTPSEKKKFIRESIKLIKEKTEERIDEVPENWNGIELGWWIKENVEQMIYPPSTQPKRFKDFKNDLAVKSL
jgi:hypothetical protein